MVAVAMIMLKSQREIEKIRASSRILKSVLSELVKLVRPGITTEELDKAAYRLITESGAKPSFLGYRGFPGSICASINEEVVHGIPSKSRVLKEGDILSLDCGVYLDGYHSDAARTVPVGKVSEEARELIQVTQDSLFKGLEEAVKPGAKIGDLSSAIQSYVESNGYSVVRDYVGHGIGRELHEEPAVPNYGKPGRGITLEPGLVIAIEPMVNAGGPEVRVKEDAWTVVTEDGELSSHHEETVVITPHGYEILTRG
jgi:methionyl aminopeptidase